MKKILALTLVGVMLCSMSVMAASSPSAGSTASTAVVSSSAPAAPSSSEEAVYGAAVVAQAAAEGKSAAEYTNNAVVSLPGVENVVPMGQGGHVIINGAPSNVIFFLAKPNQNQIASAKSQAAALGGKVLNVVTTKSYVVGKFQTATVNFYAKGVKAGQLIKVYQLVDGQWVELIVKEIREDHVVVDMTSHGTLAFIEVPAAPAA